MPSDLHALLRAEHSRRATDKVLDWLATKPIRVNQLVECVLGTDRILAQRASAPLGFLGEEHPHLLKPHLDQLIDTLASEPVHVAVHRSILRLLQFADLTEKQQVQMLDQCALFLQDHDASPAILAYSITIFGKLSRGVPELQSELRLLLTMKRPKPPPPAFLSRANRVLRELDKQDVTRMNQ